MLKNKQSQQLITVIVIIDCLEFLNLDSHYFLNQISKGGKSFKYYGYDGWNDPSNIPIGYKSKCKSNFNITHDCGFRDLNDGDEPSANNIVWGVGRGSSVASYCLYLLGIHKIDSIKYLNEINLNLAGLSKLSLRTCAKQQCRL